MRAAAMLDPDTAASVAPSEALSTVITALMRDIEAPQGLAVLGYDAHDIDGLVEGTPKQQRLLAIAPRTPDAEDLAWIFTRSMENF
jgi:hydroxyacid-oxoacid transhydrogenase